MKYRNNNYIYIEKENGMFPLFFDLSKFSNKDIHNLLGQGISQEKEYNYLFKKYGRNTIKMRNKTFFHLLIEQILHPFYLYQFLTITIWIYTSYTYYAIITIFMMSIILVVNTMHTTKNYNKILSFSKSVNSKIIRNFDTKDSCLENAFESIYIVPGDIIEVKSGEILPCDAILLDGIVI